MLELGQPLHAYDDRQLDGDDRRALRARGRERSRCSTARCSTLDARPAADRRRDEAARPRRHHGRRAFGHRRRHDARLPRRRVLEPRRDPGQDAPPRLHAATRATASSAASISTAARRAIERATQLILEICGGRAGPLTDVAGDDLPRAPPVRVRARARRAAARRRRSRADAIADVFTRLGFAFVAQATTISS